MTKRTSVRRGEPRRAGETLREARRRKESATARLRELDLRHRRGELIDRQRTERQLFERTRRLRDALLAWPMEVAPLVIALTGGELRPVLDLLEREMRKFLFRLVAELSHEVDPDPKAA